jgi:potassium-transporting ATPase KdpC subunit
MMTMMTMMTMREAWVAARFAAVWLLLAGLAWPVGAALLGGVLFPWQATGSVIVRDGVAVGSALVGQPFRGEGYLHGRPSAAGYDPFAVSGSNLAASHPALRERAATDAAAIAAREGVSVGAIPVDLVAASGSGIDPHVTEAAARLQLPRIARARGMGVDGVETLLERHIERGLGPARVNVLGFNLALDGP